MSLPAIRCKRVYLPPARDDGLRVLVERLWPRGVSKVAASIDLWRKDIAPSQELRRWYDHDAGRWSTFCLRYREELDANTESVGQLLELAQGSPLTLVYAARDEPGNSAQLLREYLIEQLGE